MSERLFRLCAKGDYQAVETLLQRGANLAARDARGWTLLDQAAAVGQMPMVELLLAYGADPQAPDLGGYTPLYRAIKAGNEEIALHLLELPARGTRPALNPLRASVNELLPKDPMGLDALLVLAAGQGLTRLAERLLEKGVSPQARERALMEAAWKGTDTVELLSRGCRQEQLDSALSNAIHANRAQAARVLLQRGARPNDRSLEHAVYHQLDFLDELREQHPAGVRAAEQRVHCKHEHIVSDEFCNSCSFCGAWWPR